MAGFFSFVVVLFFFFLLDFAMIISFLYKKEGRLLKVALKRYFHDSI
jgi:hypothetical protein